MSNILASLNESQRKAVLWADGPLLVLAGPGSGKTRVLTTRIARVLNESPGKAFRALALTFTHKAAEEMRGRMRELSPDQGRRASLTTFHAFATDILRQHARHVGLKPDFRLVTSKAELKKLQSRAIERAQENGVAISANTDVSASIETILKQGLLAPEAAGAFRDPAIGERMATLYSAYLDVLREGNASDFGALLVFARELLERRSVIAKQIRTTYPHVCVDEFQDTNVAQYRLLHLIADPATTDLFVVADDDQIIYAWNGASTDRLRALKSDFNVSILQLPENYRCPHDVVLLANTLIAHNADRSEEKADLSAIKEAGLPSVRIFRFKSLDDEIAWIANDITAREDRGRCVILARTRRPLQLALEKLSHEGIPAILTARKEAFTSAPVLWLDRALRLMCRRVDPELAAELGDAFRSIEGLRIEGGDDSDLSEWVAAALEHEALSDATRIYLVDLSTLASRGDFLGVIQRTNDWFDAVRPTSEPSNTSAWEAFDEERAIWSDNHSDILERIDPADLTIAVYLQEFDEDAAGETDEKWFDDRAIRGIAHVRRMDAIHEGILL